MLPDFLNIVKHISLNFLINNSHCPFTNLSFFEQHEFEGIARQFENHPQIRLILKYDEALSHAIYAASDIFVIPSIFEPCGLTQV